MDPESWVRSERGAQAETGQVQRQVGPGAEERRLAGLGVLPQECGFCYGAEDPGRWWYMARSPGEKPD